MKLGLATVLLITLIFWLMPEDKVIQLSNNVSPAITTNKNKEVDNNTTHPTPTGYIKQGLIIDYSLKNLFDRHLLEYPEQSLESISLQLRKSLATELTIDDVNIAMDIWRDYLGLKQALVEFDQANLNQELNSLEAVNLLLKRQQALIDLRTAYLGKQTAEAFYAEDNLKDQQTLSRMAIVLDKSLSAEERTQQLQSWHDNLPAETRQQRHRVTAHWAISEMTDNLTGEELSQARGKILDPETVARLEALDKKQADWKNKISRYTDYRQSLASSGLSSEDQQQPLANYLQKNFNQQEQLRIRAMQAQQL